MTISLDKVPRPGVIGPGRIMNAALTQIKMLASLQVMSAGTRTDHFQAAFNFERYGLGG